MPDLTDNFRGTNMVVYTLEQRWEVGLRSTCRRCRFWQKESSFHMKFILILANFQNCRIWGTEKPHAYIEKPTHPKRVSVWCGFWSGGIIGNFSSKMSKERQLQSMAIVIGPCWTNFCSQKFKRRILATFGFNRTALRANSQSYTRCFAPCFWRLHYQPQNWYRLATSELRFDTVGLLFVGCRQR